MKLTDYVIQFIADLGVKRAFVISGGAAVHLIDSISKHPDIEYVCNNHEQACAMAADGYSRVSGNIGVAIVTSGPGATNLLTGVAGAWYDSVPVLYITGQVTTWRLKGDSGCRQVGFQETDTVAIFKSVTKYATQIRDKNEIAYELEKAVYMAKEGRPGPVLIDLPDDLQRSDVDVDQLVHFGAPLHHSDFDVSECIEMLSNAERPVIVLGNGVRLSKAEEETKKLVESLDFPVLQTWAVMDILPFAHPLNAGSFGQHGGKYGNVTIQNSDMLLVLGSRLDTHHTGTQLENLAPNAKKVVVDVDARELGRMNVDVKINTDIKSFVDKVNSRSFRVKDVSEWRDQVNSWRQQYPTVVPRYYDDTIVNPYVFFRELSHHLRSGQIVLTDTGSSLAWCMQSFEFNGQRIFSDFNNTSMGWALPAAIGAVYASGEKVVTFMGDGGLQMNIQELATIRLRNLPIKMFVINNKGYSMIRQTQDDWLE